jgi:aminoglycoside phosphotransferase (APT) family kinase protein
MSEPRPSRKMHDEEVLVVDSMVRRLVDTQFPQWSDLSLRRVRSTGTDNAIFRLGDDMGVRLPRIHWAVSQVDMEWDWLPRLGGQLPAAVPIPLAKGQPGFGYPYPWLVSPWLEGEDLQRSSAVDLDRTAMEVAAFVVSLQGVSTGARPPAGKRAGVLTPLDGRTRWAIGQLEGLVDIDRAAAVWDEALRAEPWDRAPVWTHGDLLAANIIMRGNSLAGVIDWSCAGIGDPACDAQLAWFFPPKQRTVFLNALGFDAATRTRARGWVVWQTATFIPYYSDTIPEAVATAKLRLQAVLDDTSEVG